MVIKFRVLSFQFPVFSWMRRLCQLPTANCRLAILICCLIPIHFLGGAGNDTHIPDEADIVKVDSFYSGLNIDIHQTENPELYNEVYRWYGTCYRYGGSNISGVDCSHFVNALYAKIYGIKLEGNAATIYQHCHRLKDIHKIKEGDLVFFKIHGKHISHVGIYLQNGKFAHATTKLGVTISDMSEPYYKNRVYKVGRVRS